LGERLDPETLSHVLASYFEGVKPVVERHGGTLAKFIGDAVMAVFGLDELHEDDALRAVRAAVEMRETLARLNESFEQRFSVVLATRTGINTGLVAGEALAPDQGLLVGTQRIPRRAYSRPPSRGRFCSPSRRIGSCTARSKRSPWRRSS
jgi:Adenylate and Guanylate cyclase catalytic domain